MLALFLVPSECPGAEDTPPSPSTNQLAETNLQALLQLHLQLRAELRATQAAIEQSRQETRAAAAQSEETLSKGLEAIQAAFAAQRTQVWEAMQRANRTVLTAVGAFAAVGLLGILLMTCFQWRMSKGLASISAALPAALGLDPLSARAALGPAESPHLPLPAATEQHEPRIPEPDRRFEPAVKPRKGRARSIEQRLFPSASDAFRRRQFRALKAALVVGLAFAGVVTLLLFLVYWQHAH